MTPEDGLPPILPRHAMPAVSVPKWLLRGATGLAFLLAVVSLFPEVNEIPAALRAVLIALPIVVGAVWWVIKVVSPTLRVAVDRHHGYDALFDALERERSRALGDQERLREATRLLTLFAMFPQRVQAFSYPMLDVLMKDSEIRLTLGRMDNAPPSVAVIPRVGDILQVIDPVDGFWQAELRVMEERSNSGRRIAKVVRVNALFKSILVQRAMAGEALQIRARALYVVEFSSEDSDNV